MNALCVVVSTLFLLGSVQCDVADTTLQDFYSYQQVLLLKLLKLQVENITESDHFCTCRPEGEDVPMSSTHLRGMREEYALSSCSDLAYSHPSRFYYITTPHTPPIYIYCEVDRLFNYHYYGNWFRVAQLDMRFRTDTCPSGFKTVMLEDGRMGHYCTRKSQGCTSHYYRVHGYKYQTVCGKVIALQGGKPDAFFPSVSSPKTIDDTYVDGVSITYGMNPRQHIWTFAVAMHEQPSLGRHLCPCTNSENPQINNIFIPDFVGIDYFCDTGSSSTAVPGVFYGDNPLWDGDGCGELDNCCLHQDNQQFFCTHLPEQTSDPIEVRICADQQDEEIFLQQLELYVK